MPPLHPRPRGQPAGIMDGTEIVTAEEFAARHFHREGWVHLV